MTRTIDPSGTTLVAAPTREETVIRARGLRKRRGDRLAVDGVDLDVMRGEVFGIFGPDGTGKTTVLGMLSGLVGPDEGEVEVAGYDPSHEAEGLRRVVGVPFESPRFLEGLDPHETLALFADLRDADGSPGRIRGLLEEVSLAEAAKERVGRLSTGQRRRLSLALALVGDPRILLLDEPTAGLDAEARRGLPETVRAVAGGGRRTVVLATRCAEEAQEPCDRVAILDRGRVLACDTPRALVRSLKASATVSATLDGPLGPHPDANLDLLLGVVGEERDGGYVRLRTADVPATVAGLRCFAKGRGIQLRSLSVRGADLADVFVSRTGSTLPS
jgi:ABC-2 type transport system ATP-binding protein